MAANFTSTGSDTFPAGHVVKINYGQITSATVSNNAWYWTSYLVTLDMTSPTAGNILYVIGTTGGHVNINAGWCNVKIQIQDSVQTSPYLIGADHAAAYVDDNVNWDGGGGSVMGRYVIPSNSGTITVRMNSKTNHGDWSVTGSHMICMEVQG